jgi:hypothetical protein
VYIHGGQRPGESKEVGVEEDEEKKVQVGYLHV